MRHQDRQANGANASISSADDSFLVGFGHHAQYSVYECRLKRGDVKRLEKRIRALIREEEDDVRLYLLCEQCVPRIRPLGKAELAPRADYRIL